MGTELYINKIFHRFRITIMKMSYTVDSREYILALRELGKTDIPNFISKITTFPFYSLNRTFHHVMRYYESIDNIDIALPIIRPLMRHRYDNYIIFGETRLGFLRYIIRDLVMATDSNDYCDYLGDYCNDKVIDEIYRCVYDLLCETHKSEDVIIDMKRATAKLQDRNSIPRVQGKLAKKITYNVPYASFKDKHELHKFFVLNDKEMSNLMTSIYSGLKSDKVM